MSQDEERVPRIRNITQVYRLLAEYEEAVRASKLADGSKVDYAYFASCFVRWLDGDFEPGGTL